MPLLRGSGRKQKDPDGLAGNQQRGQARWDLLLGPMQRPVANEKEENADDDAGADLRPSGTQALSQTPCEKNGTGNEMPEAGGVKRRNAFNRISNCQVRGSPDEVNSKKARDDRKAMPSLEKTLSDHWQSFFNSDGNLVRAHLFTDSMCDAPVNPAPKW